MSPGTLEFTVVSATISRDAGFDFELVDTYATIRCIKEQRSTKTARDQGRLPAWNEVFTFNLEEEDLLKDILVQVFAVKSELDELLGLAKIPILTVVGKTEGTLCSLNCPGKGEVGQLMASWRWTPAAKDMAHLYMDLNIRYQIPEIRDIILPLLHMMHMLTIPSMRSTISIPSMRSMRRNINIPSMVMINLDI